jgi:hypothetical protein
MRLKTQTRLLIDAVNMENEDLLWQQYLVDYSNMDPKHFTNFEEYKKKAFTQPIEKVDKEKVLAEAERIKKADQKGGK